MSTGAQKPIQSIQRAVDIINCFTENEYLLTLATISKKVSLNINTTRGIVNTLVANDILRFNHVTKEYCLGYYFMLKGELAHKQVEELLDLSKSVLLSIADKYRVTCSLQTVNRDEIFTVFCGQSSTSAYRVYTSQYLKLPIYATSSGKLLLYYNILEGDAQRLDTLDIDLSNAFTPYTITDKEILIRELETIPVNQYVCEVEEYDLGIGSIAVPIFGPGGHIVATVSITAFINIFTEHYISISKDLKHVANILTNQLTGETSKYLV